MLIHEVLHDTSHELGVDPGLIKDGVEAHRRCWPRAHPHARRRLRWCREYMTAIGPVDILCRDGVGGSVAVEIKRRGDIDGVEQLTRYLELMNRDPHLMVTGVFAAQEIKPQARTLAQDRGIRCVTLDYDALRASTTRRPGCSDPRHRVAPLWFGVVASGTALADAQNKPERQAGHEPPA